MGINSKSHSVRTLYVKPITHEELIDNWGIDLPFTDGLFIRCNKSGSVLWDKSLVYSLTEIRSKEKVVFIL